MKGPSDADYDIPVSLQSKKAFIDIKHKKIRIL